ncbi:hypothetical protein I7I53_08163 [Histoplasma capsulatum var. duboisii H88]|uniref:Uncharacterized protein n=2 Tax=Ajellomyces capsulatus (strain H88) TaxID=544711 RepID=A0A8A1LJ70_AJEC8|nr:hypothetical protein I7I53_08163 [Histoplasma capsulatum var. duboisii H88]
MFNPNSSSPTPNPTSHTRPYRKSFTLPATPSKLALPRGECRFILLHPSVPDQRCSCQGFRRNESRPGTTCECGHQACYHMPGNMVSSSQVSEPVSPPALAALLERVSQLEEQQRHDRGLWEEALKEERQARREDARVLREAMHSFYKFMEREVPQKFAAVDDKTDSLLDHVSRLEERIGIIDDSTMGLETRVFDLEGDDSDGDDLGDVHGNDVDTLEREGMKAEKTIGEDERNPKRTRRKWQTLVPSKSTAASRCHFVSISKSPRISSYSLATGSAFPLDLIKGHSPRTGAHTYVHRLTSPSGDFVTPLLSKQEIPPFKTIQHATAIQTASVPLIKPPRPRSGSASGMQNVVRKDSASQQQFFRAYPSPEEKGIGPYCELPNPPPGKRKFDAEGQYEPETRQRPVFIPMPPPLPLSASHLKA